MKELWSVVLYISVVWANKPFDDNESQVHGENGWYLPREDGTFYWSSQTYLDSLKPIDTFGLTTVPVDYFLYTKSNPSEGTKITDNTKSVEASQFNVNNPTYIIIHGWTQSYDASDLASLRSAALRSFDCNVIMVDWARARSVDYVSSVLAVPETGEKLAEMINFLNEYCNMSLDTLTIVGHSLGAHVAGYAGRNIRNGKAHKIIGLDAAMPLFSYDSPETSLNENDAVYVQAIHTTKIFPGFLKPIGKADFYPNGADSQPGCESELLGFCSHIRAIYYYAEVLEYNNFGSIKCENYTQAVESSCGDILSSVRMGARDAQDEVEGVYYVPVNDNSPYGILNETKVES